MTHKVNKKSEQSKTEKAVHCHSTANKTASKQDVEKLLLQGMKKFKRTMKSLANR